VRLAIDVEIAASPQEVWDSLVGFDGYSQWNEWLPELHGEAVEGGELVKPLGFDGRRP
jgi:uncharacterized protein YndB with AHSA1/START domain